MRMYVSRLHPTVAYHLLGRYKAARLRLGLRRIHETVSDKDYASHHASHILRNSLRVGIVSSPEVSHVGIWSFR
jgi:hypothetical protein